jgi:uncharacterized membrane protein
MRRRPYFVPIAMIVLGMIALYNLTQRPSFQAYRMVDAFTLVAVGMLVGVALTQLAFLVRHGNVKAS